MRQLKRLMTCTLPRSATLLLGLLFLWQSTAHVSHVHRQGHGEHESHVHASATEAPQHLALELSGADSHERAEGQACLLCRLGGAVLPADALAASAAPATAVTVLQPGPTETIAQAWRLAGAGPRAPPII